MSFNLVRFYNLKYIRSYFNALTVLYETAKPAGVFCRQQNLLNCPSFEQFIDHVEESNTNIHVCITGFEGIQNDTVSMHVMEHNLLQLKNYNYKHKDASKIDLTVLALTDTQIPHLELFREHICIGN